MLLPSVLAVALAISIEGGSTCPAPDLVQERLAPLLPRDQQAAQAHVARIERSGDDLVVELRNRGGELLASRRLRLAGDSCAARAKTIAVLLAAWEVRLRGVDAELPAPVPVPAPAPAPPPPPPAAATRAAPPAAVATRKVDAAPRRIALELGAAALASITSGQVAFGGLVTAVLGPSRGLWVLVADLDGVGNHTAQYGGAGLAEWYRFGLGLGPGLRLRWRWVIVEGDAMVSVSWLQIQGVGFSNDQASGDVDVAMGGGLRIATSVGKLHPWVGVRVKGWLRGERVQVSGLAGPQQLPNVEVLPALGCDLDLL
ncbi:MAG: hypothetical protein ACYDCL_01070 [Myxococcales bacterium]